VSNHASGCQIMFGKKDVELCVRLSNIFGKKRYQTLR
jgi:hypothetical protein